MKKFQIILLLIVVLIAYRSVSAQDRAVSQRPSAVQPGAGTVPPKAASENAESLEKARQVAEASKKLEDDWETEKNEYRQRFEEQLAEIDKQTDDLSGRLDFGDPELRHSINEQLFSLRQSQERARRKLQEIKAASAIDLVNVKKRVDSFMTEMKEKITGQTQPNYPEN